MSSSECNNGIGDGFFCIFYLLYDGSTITFPRCVKLADVI